jgi:hypothetical protein
MQSWLPCVNKYLSCTILRRMSPDDASPIDRHTHTHTQQAFRYYDTTVAVINAHLPATAAYAGPSPLRKRDQHVAAMLRALRIGGAEHEAWDAHLQFHHGACAPHKGRAGRVGRCCFGHQRGVTRAVLCCVLCLSAYTPLSLTNTHLHIIAVILLGDLNWRMRLHPDEVLRRVAASAADCQNRVAGGVGGKPPAGVAEAAREGGWRCVCVCMCVCTCVHCGDGCSSLEEAVRHQADPDHESFSWSQGPLVRPAVGRGGVGGL